MNDTFRVFQWATSYGYDLVTARLPTDDEKKPYAEWFREQLLFGVEGDTISLEHFSWQDITDVFGDRKATHSFPGCNNKAWILQPGDEAKILAIEERRKADKVDAANAEKQAEIDRRTEITKRAAETGINQALSGYHGSCDGTASDCSGDWISTMVRPDGTTYERRTHTY